MSTTNKTVIGIVVVAVIALVAIFAFRAHTVSQTATATNDSLTTSPSDTSDAALQKDSATIGTQLDDLDGDTATVDQGISESQQ